MNCQNCNAPERTLTQCPSCTREVCGNCMPGEECRSCAGPFSKVKAKPLPHDDAVAGLKSLGIYEQCVEAFGWST